MILISNLILSGLPDCNLKNIRSNLFATASGLLVTELVYGYYPKLKRFAAGKNKSLCINDIFSHARRHFVKNKNLVWISLIRSMVFMLDGNEIHMCMSFLKKKI